MNKPSNNYVQRQSPAKNLPDGVWTVAMTPFDSEGKIDWNAAENLIEWYIKSGVSGIFACCLSSEVYQLSRSEIINLSKFFVDTAAKRVPVISGAMGGGDFDDKLELIKEIDSTGVEAVILNIAEFVEKEQSDDVFFKNVEKVSSAVTNIDLGLYECPRPYHRLLAAETVGRIASTGRFVFYKDTCCNINAIKEKIKALSGTPLKFYNAQTNSLLDSLLSGASGFCGIGANYCPELYVWLCKYFSQNPAKANTLQQFITKINKVIETKYPRAGKEFHYLNTDLGISPKCKAACDILDDQEKNNLKMLAKEINNFWITFNKNKIMDIMPEGSKKDKKQYIS